MLRDARIPIYSGRTASERGSRTVAPVRARLDSDWYSEVPERIRKLEKRIHNMDKLPRAKLDLMLCGEDVDGMLALSKKLKCSPDELQQCFKIIRLRREMRLR